MATLTLKDVPGRLHQALKLRARSQGRSLNREAIACLEQAVRPTRIDAPGVLALARSVRASIGARLTGRDLARFKRAGRR